VLRHAEAGFVTSKAPRAAMEFSFGPSCAKLRVEADVPGGGRGAAAIQQGPTTDAKQRMPTTDSNNGFQTTDAKNRCQTTDANNGCQTTDALLQCPTTDANKGCQTTDAKQPMMSNNACQTTDVK